MRAVAADYPDTAFAFGSGGTEVAPNFSVFDNWLQDPAYLAGMLSGGLTKSDVIGVVGALLGGPGVAAALLIFTRIFKKPLRGIGRASYCVTGSWQEPAVERLSAEQLEQGELCAELPPNGVPTRPEVAAR